MERFARDKHSSLLGPFKYYEKMKCCEYDPWSLLALTSNNKARAIGLAADKHSSPFTRRVSNKEKSFIIKTPGEKKNAPLGPVAIVIKLFLGCNLFFSVIS